MVDFAFLPNQFRTIASRSPLPEQRRSTVGVLHLLESGFKFQNNPIIIRKIGGPTQQKFFV